MSKDTEVRTYNVRDGHGILDFSTDSLAELIDHLDQRKGRYSIDDFEEKDLRARLKREQRDEEAATREAVKAGKDRHRWIQGRAKELAEDPKALAEAVAALEHDSGRANEDG